MEKKNGNHYDFDIISIGDATLDTFLDVKEAGVLYDAADDVSLFCMNYKDIIPVSSVIHKVAGNAANNAVGSSRLGMKVAFYTELGEDETASKVIDQLKAEKISLRYLNQNKGTNSNYTVVINYRTERTQLIYRHDRNYRLPKFQKSRWIYLTAMDDVKPLFYKSLIQYIEKNNTYLGFNPGGLQIRKGAEYFKKILKKTRVLFLNKEETRLMFGFKALREDDPKKEMKEYLFKAWDAGPDMMVITDGEKGAYAFDGKVYYYLPVRKVKIVERTGAGDAFSTAFIAALDYDKSVKEALKWGAFNGASVIGKVGPQDGLLSLYKIRQLIKKHKNYQVQEI